MGCLFIAFVLAIPRFIMVMLWLFTNYISRAYDSWIIPLIGFFILPTTTLAYAYAQNRTKGDDIDGLGIVIIIVGFALDAGIWGRGRGLMKRDVV